MQSLGLIALVAVAIGLLGKFIMDAAKLIAKSIDRLTETTQYQVNAQRALNTELRTYGRKLELWRRHNMGEPESQGLGDRLMETIMKGNQQSSEGETKE